MTISELAVLYPVASVDDAQIEAMADLWLEDLGHLSPTQFREAVLRWRKTQRFFPTVADLLKMRQELDAQEPKRARLALEYLPPNHEQTARVVQLTRVILQRNPGLGYRQAYEQAKERTA